AVAKRRVGDKIPISAFLDHLLASPATGMRAEAVGWGTGRRLQRPRRRRVIAMRMGDQDVRDLLVRETGEQRFDMLGEAGAAGDEAQARRRLHGGGGSNLFRAA